MSIPGLLETNPYQKLFYRAMAKHGFDLVPAFPMGFGDIWKNRRSVDVIHIHWMPASEAGLLKSYYWSVRAFFRLLFCRLLGIKIIWTAHNLIPHDTRNHQLQCFQRFWLVRVCHLILVHFEGAKDLIGSKFGADPRKMITVHHGLYNEYYANSVSREQAREYCGIEPDKKVFLYFGLIKPYKNIEAIIGAFKNLDDPKAVLLLAGNVPGEGYKKSIAALVDDGRIKCEFKFIEDKNVEYYFNCADCVVLPYKNIFTSGAALLAMTFKRPLIMKKCDFSVEYLSGHPANILIEDCDEASIQKAMESFLNYQGPSALSDKDIEPFKWASIADRLVREDRFSNLFKK